MLPQKEITYLTKELQYLANMYNENKGNNKRVILRLIHWEGTEYRLDTTGII